MFDVSSAATCSHSHGQMALGWHRGYQLQWHKGMGVVHCGPNPATWPGVNHSGWILLKLIRVKRSKVMVLSWRDLRRTHFGIICDNYGLSHCLWLKGCRLKMQNLRWSVLVWCLLCLLYQKCSSKLSPNQNQWSPPLAAVRWVCVMFTWFDSASQSDLKKCIFKNIML